MLQLSQLSFTTDHVTLHDCRTKNSLSLGRESGHTLRASVGLFTLLIIIILYVSRQSSDKRVFSSGFHKASTNEVEVEKSFWFCSYGPIPPAPIQSAMG